MNYKAIPCFFCSQDMISNLVVLKNSNCKCAYHQECLKKFVMYSEPQNLNSCPKCFASHDFKNKQETRQIHYQAEYEENQKESSAEQILKDIDHQFEVLQGKQQIVEQSTKCVQEKIEYMKMLLQDANQKQEALKQKLSNYSNFTINPNLYAEYQDRLKEKIKQQEPLQKELKFYQNIYYSYYNDTEINYEEKVQECQLSNDTQIQLMTELKKNQQIIQELRSQLESKNVKDFSKQLIRLNFCFPELNKDQLSLLQNIRYN